MAETTTTTTATAKPADKQNWADMEHDEEDEHEDIGLASKVPEAAPAKVEGEEEKKEEPQGEKPQRKRKDYGDAYDPNYNKKKWRKGIVNDEQKKNMAPAIARQKNERGDYVVTSFVIPERKDAVKAEKVSTEV
jgi:hypothetical protein